MKRKFKLLFYIVCLGGTSVMAQPSLDSLLNLVDSENPGLIAAQHLLEAQVLNAKTGLTPSNPEVEFGYMWGRPDDVGTRVDFKVTQAFDFPTVYTAKSDLSKINQQQAELQYYATRQKVLVKARQVWIERVFLNLRKSMLNGRLAYAETVMNGFEHKLESGESNQLQMNQARMQVATNKNEINRIDREMSANRAQILNLTGDHVLSIYDSVFPASQMVIYDSLVTRYHDGFINEYYQVEVDKKAKEVDVVFNQKLPKLKAGYYSESILDVKLRGIQAGITIPLWENARAVRTAKASLAYAETDADGYWRQKQNELVQNYEQWVLLKENVSELEQMLTISNDEDLLRQAMEAGEISLTEYFYESGYYFQNLLNLIEVKKEMLLLEAELRKVYY